MQLPWVCSKYVPCTCYGRVWYGAVATIVMGGLFFVGEESKDVQASKQATNKERERERGRRVRWGAKSSSRSKKTSIMDDEH